ncbi:MAG TPA: type III-B CRISPR module RAMP protein Cmr1 [Ktedonobacteraceae bacterium]|nr:type III-B CRISPR module RAMP protein Cmr1 [Ktedonobacteraceae bacterium]
MGRNQPPDPPEVRKWSTQPPERAIGGTPVIVQTRRYRLLTPLFGGGVEAGANDSLEQTLIRGSEIRGQLRFWWRAIRGWQWGSDLEVMYKHESEIWGAASDAKNHHQADNNGNEADESKERKWNGVVQISVTIQDKGQTLKPFEPYIKEGKPRLRTHKDIPEYAAFPLRPPEEQLRKEREQTLVNDLRKDIVFTLEITFVEQFFDDVQAALWAWETFGGVGARTRRGFGVISLDAIDGKKEGINLPHAHEKEARAWLEGELKRWIKKSDYPENVPHLTLDMPVHIIDLSCAPIVAWKNIIDKLQEFRQAPHGRERRSKWPEAEAIREITGYRLQKPYRKLNRLGHPQKFPRAVFGLPIVFHFKDEDKKHPLDHNADPPEMILQGADVEGQERWASPLILRPLICQEGRALSMACVLQGSQLPAKMLLKPTNARLSSYEVNLAQTRLTADEAKTFPVQGQPNVLQAFLDFLK